MKSQFELLHCPCGCELNAHNRLELLYQALIDYYGDNVVITSLVNCEMHNNHSMFATFNQHPDRVAKYLRTLKSHGFRAVYYVTSSRWLLTVKHHDGVQYESSPEMGEHPNL